MAQSTYKKPRHGGNDFTAHVQRFPPHVSRRVSPRSLREQGFAESAEGVFRKSFSGLLHLRIAIVRGIGKFYEWTLDSKVLENARAELRAIRDSINTETKELYPLLRQATGKYSEGMSSKEEFVKEWAGAGKRIRTRKAEFRNQYKDFLALIDGAAMQKPYVATQFFFFDACKTTAEFELYCRFIRLYLQVFFRLPNQRPGRHPLSSSRRWAVIEGYFLALSTIQRIRHLYRNERVQLRALKKKFRALAEPLIDDIVLEGGGKSNWVNSASGLARTIAGSLHDIGPWTVREIMDSEPGFVKKVKKTVLTLDEPEKLLRRKVPIPGLWPARPEKLRKEQAIELITAMFD